MDETAFSAWTVGWLVWSAAMLLDFAAAAVRRKRTFSEHVWGRWFVEPWKRVVFLIFWQTCGVHFACAGRGWYASGYAVAITAAPVAALIAWREKAMWQRIWSALKTVGSKLKGAGSYVARRGPLVSALLTGAAVAFPQASVALKTAAAVLAASSGGTVDQAVVQSFGEVLAGGLLLFGALRKFWSLSKPLLKPSPEPPPAVPAK